ncbi:putative toxin [Nocardia fluminea]|uniref:putative toxin n=1 Tax=Nocardia fluminea TaxID=134984 RepID=UPI003790E81F
MSELDVDPELFYDLSGQYSTASRTASTALTTMDRELRDAVNMAGNDPCGESWGRGYTICGVEATVTAGRATEVLAKMALLVRQSGINHDQSENAEDYNSGKILPPSDPGSKTFICRPLKSPKGGSRAKPAAWDIVMQPEMWIDGNATLMEQVSTSWLNAASAYGTLDVDLRKKMANLSGSQTDEMPDIQDAHNSVIDAFDALSDSMRNISGAVGGYSATLKDVQEYSELQLTLLSGAVGADVLGALIGGKAVSAGAKKLADIEIDIVRDRIQLAMKALTQAELLSSSTFTAASGTVRYVMTSKFQPVLDKQLKNPPPPASTGTTKRNRLEGEKAEMRAGIDPMKTKESLIGDSGKRRTPDDLDHGQQRLTEVKNVQNQGLTDQIRDELAYCDRRGYEFVLITDNNTKLTAEMQSLVNQGKIKHVRMDFRS